MELKFYGRALLHSCFLDILLAILFSIVLLEVQIYEGNYFIISRGYFTQFFNFGRILLYFSIVILICNLLSMPLPFYIRYLAICR
uniref:Uncharacterized protein n=1 Tax=Panagrolaimus davidi TaxID=227884 RepID=A0A914PNF5_9BILA